MILWTLVDINCGQLDSKSLNARFLHFTSKPNTNQQSCHVKGGRLEGEPESHVILAGFDGN